MKRTSRHIAAALRLSLCLLIVLTAQFWHVHGVPAAGDGRIVVSESGASSRHAVADAGLCPACQLASETGPAVRTVPSLSAHPAILAACACAIPLQRPAGPSSPRAPPSS